MAPSTRNIWLPILEINMIEVVGSDDGNTSIGQQTWSKKQDGNVTLMTCVIETYDPDTYVIAQGVLEWENDMATIIDSLTKNQT